MLITSSWVNLIYVAFSHCDLSFLLLPFPLWPSLFLSSPSPHKSYKPHSPPSSPYRETTQPCPSSSASCVIHRSCLIGTRPLLTTQFTLPPGWASSAPSWIVSFALVGLFSHPVPASRLLPETLFLTDSPALQGDELPMRAAAAAQQEHEACGCHLVKNLKEMVDDCLWSCCRWHRYGT